MTDPAAQSRPPVSLLGVRLAAFSTSHIGDVPVISDGREEIVHGCLGVMANDRYAEETGASSPVWGDGPVDRANRFEPHGWSSRRSWGSAASP
jgi:hypothetical protein